MLDALKGWKTEEQFMFAKAIDNLALTDLPAFNKIGSLLIAELRREYNQSVV